MENSILSAIVAAMADSPLELSIQQDLAGSVTLAYDGERKFLGGITFQGTPEETARLTLRYLIEKGMQNIDKHVPVPEKERVIIDHGGGILTHRTETGQGVFYRATLDGKWLPGMFEERSAAVAAANGLPVKELIRLANNPDAISKEGVFAAIAETISKGERMGTSAANAIKEMQAKQDVPFTEYPNNLRIYNPKEGFAVCYYGSMLPGLYESEGAALRATDALDIQETAWIGRKNEGRVLTMGDVHNYIKHKTVSGIIDPEYTPGEITSTLQHDETGNGTTHVQQGVLVNKQKPEPVPRPTRRRAVKEAAKAKPAKPASKAGKGQSKG